MKIYKTTLIFYLKEDNMTIVGMGYEDDEVATLKHLIMNNGDEYNLAKAAEEFQELALAINQYLLRKEDSDPKKRSLQAIIDEIGDCQIRMAIITSLSHLFPKESIQERVDYKLTKFAGWIEEKKYTQI